MTSFLAAMRENFGGLGYSRGMNPDGQPVLHFPHLVAAKCFTEEDWTEQEAQVCLLVEIAMKAAHFGGAYHCRKMTTTEGGARNWWHFYVSVYLGPASKTITRAAGAPWGGT